MATLVRQVSTSHCVVAHISGPIQQFYLVSLYFQFSKLIAHYAQQLTAALECVRFDRVIIGADVNRVSPIWSEKTTTSDSNGHCFKDVIQAANLVPLNKPGNLCTHISDNKDIDITLVSPKLFDKVINWRVMEDWTLSYHRKIVFEIGKE
uniref:Endonuclease/exonuclease/phosphatase domain-containing protein n=1 Tax=Trichogramma kaykai TaxID=54128 RepID=A0ABD2W677_9HYME